MSSPVSQLWLGQVVAGTRTNQCPIVAFGPARAHLFCLTTHVSPSAFLRHIIVNPRGGHLETHATGGNERLSSLPPLSSDWLSGWENLEDPTAVVPWTTTPWLHFLQFFEPRRSPSSSLFSSEYLGRHVGLGLAPRDWHAPSQGPFQCFKRSTSLCFWHLSDEAWCGHVSWIPDGMCLPVPARCLQCRRRSNDTVPRETGVGLTRDRQRRQGRVLRPQLHASSRYCLSRILPDGSRDGRLATQS